MRPREQYDEPGSLSEAERELLGRPLALGYRPSVSSSLGLLEDGGRFGGGLTVMLRDVERMLSHPAVQGPYGYYKAGIADCKFQVKAGSRAQARFAHDALVRLWERCLGQCQLSYDYGWCGYEVNYSFEQGRMQFDGLIDLHPLDTWAVTHRGQYRGLTAQGTGEVYSRNPNQKVFLWGPRHWPAKGLWLNHRNRWNRWYGRSQLYGAWRPWRRLATRDAAEEITDGGVYRFAYRGPEVRYPVKAYRKPDGSVDYDQAREKAREIAENAKAGVSVALPNSRDEHGNLEWEIVWPDHVLNVDGLLAYIDALKKEISIGVGVPPELLEASDAGSGWSGRKVPLIGFYTQQVENARTLVRQFQIQVIDPLLRWNFGRRAWCEVVVELVVPKAIAGEPPQQAQGGAPSPAAQLAAGGEPGSSPGQPAGPPQAGGGLADLLAGQELSTLELSLADYRPHRLLRGPRKGLFVWKNFRTGKIRLSLPGRGRPAGPDGGRDGNAPAPDPRSVLARIRAMLADPSQIDDASMRSALDDLLALDPSEVEAIARRLDLGGAGAGRSTADASRGS